MPSMSLSHGPRPFVPKATALALLSLLAGCGVAPDSSFDDAPDVSLRTSALTVVDNLGTTSSSIKFQRADIIPISRTGFAVGWTSNAYGDMKYARFNGSGVREMQPTAWGSAGIEANFTIRANTSRLLETANCLGVPSKFINYAAVQLGSDVFIDTHSYEVGRNPCRNQAAKSSITRLQVDTSAVRPAVATQGTYENGRALIVYGKTNPGTGELRGRFLNWSTSLSGVRTQSLGPSFVVAFLPTNHFIFSTDVVYDDYYYANNFVIGYMSKTNFDGRVFNIALSGDASVFPPTITRSTTQWGTFDADAGGHHTSVAYAPGTSDGTYLWWALAPGTTKSVKVMWGNGDRATNYPPYLTEAVLPGTTATVPITSTFNPEMPYLFLAGANGQYYPDPNNVYSSLMGMRPDKTTFCADGCEGLTRWKGTPVAVRSLPGYTVGLTAAPLTPTSPHELLVYISNQH